MLPGTKYCTIVIFLPINGNLESFSSMCNFINAILVELENSRQVIPSGILNFPMIHWKEMQVSSNQGRDFQTSAYKFLEMMSRALFKQSFLILQEALTF